MYKPRRSRPTNMFVTQRQLATGTKPPDLPSCFGLPLLPTFIMAVTMFPISVTKKDDNFARPFLPMIHPLQFRTLPSQHTRNFVILPHTTAFHHRRMYLVLRQAGDRSNGPQR